MHLFRSGRAMWPAVLVVAAVALVAAACGSSTSSNATSTATPSSGGSPASAAAQISANWQRFFSGSTSAAQKIALLQGGQRFAKTITAQAASPIGQGIQAQVKSVKVVSPTKAIVTYSILIAGKPVLKNATGQAVLQNGAWKVGSGSFQGLLALENQSGTGASTSPGK